MPICLNYQVSKKIGNSLKFKPWDKFQVERRTENSRGERMEDKWGLKIRLKIV